jgi:isocitrate/isopropylmalate dehydrogenase
MKDMIRAYKIGVIPGDGIGPEVVDAAVLVLMALMRKVSDLELQITRGDAGEPAYGRYGDPLPEETLNLIRSSFRSGKSLIFSPM